MRRRAGQLIPIEVDILRIASAELTSGDGWIHGFAVAKDLQTANGRRRLAAHGTLYKALGRLADGALLTSRWEDADDALAGGRPRRRLYRLTAAGQVALAAAEAEAPTSPHCPTPRIAPA